MLLKRECGYRLKVNEWRKIHHANTDQKRARVTILISDRADSKAKKVIRDKEGHYIMIKQSILQEDITILSNCAPNRVSKCIRQTPIKLNREIDKSTSRAEDLTTINKQAKIQEGP